MSLQMNTLSQLKHWLLAPRKSIEPYLFGEKCVATSKKTNTSCVFWHFLKINESKLIGSISGAHLCFLTAEKLGGRRKLLPRS